MIAEPYSRLSIARLLTVYQGISGFKAIGVGRTDLEVVAQKANGRWIATEVETRGGSGGRAKDD